MNPNQRQPVNNCPENGSNGSDSRPVVVVSQHGQTVWWLLAVLLAIIATALVSRMDQRVLDKTAWGQPAIQQPGGGQVGARGIYAFPGRIDRERFGIFMMDVDAATVWCYALDRGSDNQVHLELVAARSWYWDRFLEEFNVAGPVPGAVQEMVEQQRSHRGEASQASERQNESILTDTPAEPVENVNQQED
jgi:hypothetical protein